MPSRSIRDQMQMRPAVTPGVRPTSPRPQVQPQIRPAAAPVRGGAVVGSGQSVTPQVIAKPAPTQMNVQQGMNQVNQQAIQPRVAVPVQQGPVGNAPAVRPVAPMVRPQIR